MKIDFNDVNQDIVFFAAFRYCLGRMTYVVGAMVEEMIKNWSHMPTPRRQMFKKEIRECLVEGRGGMDMDIKEWEKILVLPDEGSINEDMYVRHLLSHDPAFALKPKPKRPRKQVARYIR